MKLPGFHPLAFERSQARFAKFTEQYPETQQESRRKPSPPPEPKKEHLPLPELITYSSAGIKTEVFKLIKTLNLRA